MKRSRGRTGSRFEPDRFGIGSGTSHNPELSANALLTTYRRNPNTGHTELRAGHLSAAGGPDSRSVRAELQAAYEEPAATAS